MAHGEMIGLDHIVWAAGVFDATATCAVWQVKDYRDGEWRWRVSLYIDEATAAAWQRVTGFALRRDRARRWTVLGADAYEVMAQLLPYLQVRHEEAAATMRTIVTRGRGGCAIVRAERGRMRDRIAESRDGALMDGIEADWDVSEGRP
jgi:hypothetical protein